MLQAQNGDLMLDEAEQLIKCQEHIPRDDPLVTQGGPRTPVGKSRCVLPKVGMLEVIFCLVTATLMVWVLRLNEVKYRYFEKL